MLNLTSEERKTILFIGALLILGAVLNYFIKEPRWHKFPSLSSEQQEIKRININTASTEELVTIPGIGEVTAERIISYRQKYGPFNIIEDLKKIEGIKDKKLDSIRKYIFLP